MKHICTKIAIDVRGVQTSHNINKQEADICKQIIRKMVDWYGEEVRKDIGIITPFRNQKRYLEKMTKGVVIGTVHTFQGQEKKYILFSSVVNDRSVEFVGGQPNLLNVAVTRAKEHFTFIGNFQTAKESKSYLSDLLQTITQYGAPYSIFNTKLMGSGSKQTKEVFQLFASSAVPASTEFGKFLYNNFPENIIAGANEHYSTLLHALHKAEKSIDIISPWLKPELIKDRFDKGLNHVFFNHADVQIIFGYHKSSHATLNKIETIYGLDANKEFVVNN